MRGGRKGRFDCIMQNKVNNLQPTDVIITYLVYPCCEFSITTEAKLQQRKHGCHQEGILQYRTSCTLIQLKNEGYYVALLINRGH